MPIWQDWQARLVDSLGKPEAATLLKTLQHLTRA